MVGKIENNKARPLSREEVEAHIAEHERLRQLCVEQSAALQWARELMEEGRNKFNAHALRAPEENTK